MTKVAFLFPLALASCAASLADPREMPLFGGYTVLEIPTNEVPLGATWLQGYGPTGEGTGPDNIATESGLTAVTSSREQQRNVGLRAAPFVTINPSSRTRAAVNFSDVTIHRVKDLAALGFKPGESRIYEALRAGRLNVQVEQGSRSEVSGGARQFPVDLSGELSTQKQSNVGVEGNNLFVAYKVITAEPRSTKASRGRFRQGDNGWAASVAGYEARIPFSSSCHCDGAEAACDATRSLLITRPAAGPAEAVEFSASLSAERRQLFDLPAGKERPAAGGPLLDLTQVEVEFRPNEGTGSSDDVSSKCLATGTPTRMAVTRTTVQLKLLPEPEAPGW